MKYSLKVISVLLASFLLGITLLIPQAFALQLNIVTEQLPPYQYKEDQKVTGFASEIIKAALQKTPYQYTINIYPWSRAYNMALKKENTCIYSIARNEERESSFKWVAPIAKTTTYFIGLAENKKIKLNTLEDAKNYVTAVIKNDITHQFLVYKGFEESKHFYVVKSTDSLLKLLTLRKNIDLILVDDLTLTYRARLIGEDPQKYSAFIPLQKNPLVFYLACSNLTDNKVVDTLASALHQVKKEGLYKKIIHKWLGDEDKRLAYE